MRRGMVLSLLVLAATALAAAARAQQTPATPEMPPIGDILKVRNNLYVIPGQGGNTAVFVARTGVILVDTKLANNGQAILDRVGAVSDVPVTTIINTHTHGDHVGSNGFFSPAVEIVTQVNTAARMARMEALKDTPAALPDRTFGDRLTIGRGQDQVDLYYFGAGHTDGDAIVVFPAARSMHAGDLFPRRQSPFVDRANGGSGVAYPRTLEKALETIRNVDTVIPGHSDVTTWAAFVEYAEFTRAFLGSVEASHRAGRTADQAAADLSLPARFREYVSDTPMPGAAFTGASRARDNVAAIYAELNARPASID